MLNLWIIIVLDLLLKDPHGLYHPVQFFGFFIEQGEKLIRTLVKPIHYRLMGVLFVLAVVGIVLGLYALLGLLLSMIHPVLFTLFKVYIGYALLASGSLMEEGKRIYTILKTDDLVQGRKSLSYLVSRDTETLDSVDLMRGAIETLSENITDGIVSPLLFLVFFGVEGMIIFKVVSTFDSMIGYKNERYVDLGRFAAKLDDVLNFIPARVAAAMVMLSAVMAGESLSGSYKIYRRDHLNHASPNSACTESAVAGALGIQLGGQTSYFGQMVQKPTIGEGALTDDVELLPRVIKLILLSTLCTGVVLTFFYVMRGDFIGF